MCTKDVCIRLFDVVCQKINTCLCEQTELNVQLLPTKDQLSWMELIYKSDVDKKHHLTGP